MRMPDGEVPIMTPWSNYSLPFGLTGTSCFVHWKRSRVPWWHNDETLLNLSYEIQSLRPRIVTFAVIIGFNRESQSSRSNPLLGFQWIPFQHWRSIEIWALQWKKEIKKIGQNGLVSESNQIKSAGHLRDVTYARRSIIILWVVCLCGLVLHSFTHSTTLSAILCFIDHILLIISLCWRAA